MTSIHLNSVERNHRYGANSSLVATDVYLGYGIRLTKILTTSGFEE